MDESEILERANKMASPHGLKAEILGEDLFSVGVGGDQRSYTPIICLVGPFPGWDVIEKVSTQISNELPINRVTYQTS